MKAYRGPPATLGSAATVRSQAPLKCKISLVPAPLWGVSLARLLPRSQWDKLRQAEIARYGQTCQTCGKQPAEGEST